MRSKREFSGPEN